MTLLFNLFLNSLSSPTWLASAIRDDAAAEVSAEDDVNDDSLVESEAMTLDDVTVRTRQKTVQSILQEHIRTTGCLDKSKIGFLNSFLPTVVWVYFDIPMDNAINLLCGCSFPSVLKVF